MFMELIQAHERSWGTDQYADRPSLADLLQRPIVVLWTGDDKSGKARFTITVHNRIEEVNEIILTMILANKITPSVNRRLSRIFVKQKPAIIKGLNLIIGEKST
jgi:hypothetical protein